MAQYHRRTGGDTQSARSAKDTARSTCTSRNERCSRQLEFALSLSHTHTYKHFFLVAQVPKAAANALSAIAKLMRYVPFASSTHKSSCVTKWYEHTARLTVCVMQSLPHQQTASIAGSAYSFRSCTAASSYSTSSRSLPSARTNASGSIATTGGCLYSSYLPPLSLRHMGVMTSPFTHTHTHMSPLSASRVAAGPGVAQVADRDGARARATRAPGAPEEPGKRDEGRAAVRAAACERARQWLFVALKCSGATQQQQ